MSSLFHRRLSSSTIEFVQDLRRLRLSLLMDGVLRVHYASGRFFDDGVSYGVSPEFEPHACVADCLEFSDQWELLTPILRVVVRKSDLGLEFFMREGGFLLSRDSVGVHTEFLEWNGESRVSCKKTLFDNEHFYGLGDKPCALNMRGRRFELWGVDHYAFKSEADPLYKNIPFFVSLCEGRSYGIFFDNTTRSYVDFGAYDSHELSFGAEGGEMDYYFFHAASPLEIIESYTCLTGLSDMPPLWALGYHQSKWSYYPETAVSGLVHDLREHQIPCDSVHLDIHHMDNYQSFTWDMKLFPDPKRLIVAMEEKGIKLVSIINPGIKINPEYGVWQSGFEFNIYCRRQDGSLLEAEVWPGLCHFPDFTSPKARYWWADQFENELGELGIRGIWTDMNEPALFPDKTFPLDTRHDFDGRPCSHAKAHNVYGHCMAHATKEGMLKFSKNRRPFVISRSGYAGLQRYAATWTGDNCSTWDHLKMANLQCQRLAASGLSFCGSDVGGFLGHPTPELFCRWMQMSAFHVFFRNHASAEFGGQEPWLFGEDVMQYVRFAIEQRYRLLPYFYTQFWRYSTKGTPIIRSLALQCFEQMDTYWRSSEFFVGEHLFVVPIHHPDEKGRFLYLPEGRWYSLWDDSLAPQSNKDIWSPSPLSHIPVFVRGGAIIPRWQVQQYVGEALHPLTTLELWWVPQSFCESDLYEDEGDGFGYRKGQYLYHQFKYESTDDRFTVQHVVEGDYVPPQQSFLLCIRALSSSHVMALVDGKPFPVDIVGATMVSISLPKLFKVFELVMG